MQRILLISVALGAATLSCGGGGGLPTANGPNPTAAVTTTPPAATTTIFSTPTIAAALPTLAPITTTNAATPTTIAPNAIVSTTIAPNAATPTTIAPLPTFSPVSSTVAAPLPTLPPITTTTIAAQPVLLPAEPYVDYVTITDESGLISVSVPAAWNDTRGDLWDSSLASGTPEQIGPALSAAPSLDAYTTSWSAPGMFIGATAMATLSVEEALDRYDFTGSCTYAGRYAYDDGLYTGVYDEYYSCDGISKLYQIIAEPASQTWIALVQVQLVTQADEAAFEQIINTWEVQELAG